MSKAYVFKNKPEILEQSSSGGAFLGIAEAFFRNEANGKVYGAMFDDSFNVIHSWATTLEACMPFCGSKYVQSNMNGCHEKIVDELRNGQSVLFTGTPCQIAVVKAYVEKKNVSSQKLFTVDIACHGTPKKEFWKDYVAYLEKKKRAKLVKFSFRYKPRGWKGYPIYAEFSNGIKRINTLDVSTYQNLFRKDILMRESCFKCKFPGKSHADLTLADFWGVELCMPEIPVKGGVSLILSHTEKGRQMIEWMKERCGAEEILLKSVPGDDYIKYNHNLSKATRKPGQYQEFWNDYKMYGMEFVLKKYGGDNLIGRGKFYAKRFLRDSGLLAIVKKVLRRA